MVMMDFVLFFCSQLEPCFTDTLLIRVMTLMMTYDGHMCLSRHGHKNGKKVSIFT